MKRTIAAAVALSLFGIASAADDPGDSGGIDEVMVTARRRAEPAQDVPISITALSTDEVRERHIESAQDLATVVPSLNVSTSTVRGASSYTIRGQGATLGAGPGVVAYFAEIPLPQGNLGSVTQGGGPGLYYDLQDLQVLKGPQGTLFGRNTTGGAVLLEPKKPDGSQSGYVQAQLGDYADREIEGAVNVPLVSDKLSLRVAGKAVTRDGFTTDVVTGKDYDDRNYWSGRAGLLFTPTDAIENYTLVYGIFSHDNGGSTVPIAASTNGRAETLFPNGEYVQNLAAQEARGPRRVSLSAPVADREQLYGITDTLSIKLTDNLTLRNLASDTRFKYLANQDADGSPLAIVDTVTPNNDWNTDTNNVTEELQLLGTSAGKHLQWVAGGYYEHDNPVGLQTQWSAQFRGSPFVADSASVQSQNYIEVRDSHAVYAQGVYDFGAFAAALERLRATVGYRYSWDRKFDTTDAALPLQNFACTTIAGKFRPNCTVTATQRSEAPTYTAGLDYKLTEHVLVYGKYSRGYKTGGANPTSIDPNALTFQPEYVDDTEFGFKSEYEVAGIHGHLNADVFNDQYSDIQRTGAVFFAGKTGSATVNAARARIRGTEVEASIVPFKALELVANYSYLDAHYNSFILGTTNLTNEPFAFAPRNKYSLTARYSAPLGAQIGTLKAAVTYGHTDKWYIGVTSIEASAWVPGYNLVDLHVGLADLLNRPLEVSLFVTNLTNKTYQIGSSAYYTTLGYAQAVYGEPRMGGVQISYQFGGP